MTPDLTAGTLRLALPKGRMQDGVLTLLADAGLPVRASVRAYRPTIAAGSFNAKILKPQNIIEMLAADSRDIGFAGADWVAELGVGVVELLDTGLDPVRLVAAAPPALLEGGQLPTRRLTIASEYPRLTADWVQRSSLNAQVVRSFGATEVFPPEDADLIVDNTATGSTLAANGLDIIATLLTSSTRLYANPRALEDRGKRAAIEGFSMLLASVLAARSRVMFEVNVSAAQLEAVCAALPCMREPTIASLHGDAGFAVKAAVSRALLPELIPRVKALGGSDIVIAALSQIVP
ncbi:MAG: ATP phosphoribosyltransferase [Gemmatimonadota bacterium]